MRPLSGKLFLALVLATLLTVAPASAADQGEPSNRVKQATVLLKAHHYKWKKNRPRHYTFKATYSNAGVSPNNEFWFGNQLQIYVTDDKPVLVRNPKKKTSFRKWQAHVPTIDFFFDLITKELAKNPKLFTLSYDLQHSVPTWVEFGSVAQDVGYQYTVADFQPLSDAEMAEQLKAK